MHTGMPPVARAAALVRYRYRRIARMSPQLAVVAIIVLLCLPAAPATANTILVTSFGAIANDGLDDSTAINNAIASANPGDTVSFSAGVFSTAEDMARFCRMILNGGELEGHRILSKSTLDEMIKPRPMPDKTNSRGYGFDIDTAFQVTPEWNISAQMSYADGKVEGSQVPCNTFGPNGQPTYNTTDPTVTLPPGVTGLELVVSRQGDELPEVLDFLTETDRPQAQRRALPQVECQQVKLVQSPLHFFRRHLRQLALAQAGRQR